MTRPWIGERRPMAPTAIARAAQALGCDEAAIKAVWEVEAAGRAYRADGSVERRFEPHHMPGSLLTWRDSMSISTPRREQLFLDAYQARPEAALKATSWGAPQIMGFNHKATGHPTARSMVEAMADDEQAHLDAFVALLKDWGLDSALRGHDWLRFARRYNGTGQPEEYARRMEAAYRRHAGGSASPVVLRVGDRGDAVRRLQSALGVEVDGAFGPETLAAVRAFQEANGLAVDGVVGHMTWARLKEAREVEAPVQETPVDEVTRQVGQWAALATAVTAPLAALRELIPDDAMTMLVGAAIVAGGVWGGSLLLRRLRTR